MSSYFADTTLAIGELRGYQTHPNGDITFEVDDDVAEVLERQRRPNESDSDLLRRVIKERANMDVPRPKPN